MTHKGDRMAMSSAQKVVEVLERSERKCSKCKGKGFFPLSKERIIAYPRYTSIDCPICKGTGKIKEVK